MGINIFKQVRGEDPLTCFGLVILIDKNILV